MPFSKLFRSRVRKTETVYTVPEGQRIYAIGDIHGRFDLFRALIDKIDLDAEETDMAVTLILLGDLIDRGNQSADVVEFALQMEQASPNIRFLMGNHEEVFLKALRGDVRALRFLHRIGGRQTLMSYGISRDEYDLGDYEQLLELAQARIPDRHLAFLERFEDMVLIGDYAFVHAGVRPGVALAEQRPADLRWIRDDFLNHGRSLEKMIIHGHTARAEVDEQTNRIGIDTGAFCNGRLTAIALEDNLRWYVQAYEGESKGS